MRGIIGAATLGAALALACNTESFECRTDVDCETAIGDGTCQPTGWCSFDDNDCPSGQAYGDHAGDGLAGMCVPADDPTTSESSTTMEIGGSTESSGSSGSIDSGSSSTGLVVDDTTGSSSGGDPPCPDGFAECDGDPGTVCESSLAAPETCGSCDKSCVLPEGTLECVEGLCAGDLEITDIEDTYVDETLPMDNYASSDTLMIDGPPEHQRTLIRAVSLPVVPAGAVVSGTVLRLVIHNEGSNAQLVPISESWDVATVTWAAQPMVDDSAPEAFISNLGVVDVDVSGSMEAWLSGEPNYGVELQPLGTNKVEFRSVEFGLEPERPRFVLTLSY